MKHTAENILGTQRRRKEDVIRLEEILNYLVWKCMLGRTMQIVGYITTLNCFARFGERGSETSSSGAATGSAHSTWCRCSASETFAEEAAAEGGSKFIFFHVNCQYRLQLAKIPVFTHHVFFSRGLFQTDHQWHITWLTHTFPHGAGSRWVTGPEGPGSFPAFHLQRGYAGKWSKVTNGFCFGRWKWGNLRMMYIFLLYTTRRWWFGQILFFSPLLTWVKQWNDLILIPPNNRSPPRWC